MILKIKTKIIFETINVLRKLNYDKIYNIYTHKKKCTILCDIKIINNILIYNSYSFTSLELLL